ncbi:hypothetical protein ACQUQU_16500 [Thalassolituus sp. LLYu03]|uniref:hypothetical protein n=1 Tax=Thalassolituus sp. LLYu03 TaxID=3421656 RepID=UPI003D2E4B27
MTQTASPDVLEALKIAFSYMPKAGDVSRVEYGVRYQIVQDQIAQVRAALAQNGLDPDEVYASLHAEKCAYHTY